MRSPYLFRVYVSIPGHVYKREYLFGDEDALLCYVEPYREQAREIAYSVILSPQARALGATQHL